MSEKLRKMQDDVLYLEIILFYLYRKAKIVFSSLIYYLISSLMDLPQHLADELHDAAVAVGQLDIL
jgi:hypothetical protein